VYFDVTPFNIDANDILKLQIDGSGSNGNSVATYGYASLNLFIPKCYYGLAGDLNKDCKVNITDLGIMAFNWLTDGEPDFFHDSSVGMNDFEKLTGNWLIDCNNDPTGEGCTAYIKSIDVEDGFNRDDDYSERDRLRLGDNGQGNYYNSLISFDTRILEGFEITRAWIGLTVMDRQIWDGQNPSPDPDKLGLTLDLSSAFSGDTAFQAGDFDPNLIEAAVDVSDCAIEDDWGLTEAAVDERVLIELTPEAIAAINPYGRTQFRINTPASDDPNSITPLDYADAIDLYDGREDSFDRAPVLIVE
jgi:hypothetical protein